MAKTVKLNTGFMMPTVALGCWQLTSDEAEEAVKSAIRAGYRHIDTAQAYLNEEAIGKAVEELIKNGEITRKDIFITTKLGFAAMHPTHVEEECRRSLKNLRVDYIDLFLLHGTAALSDEGLKDEPRTTQSMFPMYSNYKLKLAFIDPVDSYKEMETMVALGFVRSLGVSNFGIEQIERLMKHCSIKPANLQNENHVWYQSDDIVQYCHQHDITFSAYSPLGCPGRPSWVSLETQNLLELPLVIELSEKYSRTAAQIVLRFLLQRDIIVLPKSVNPLRIRENIQLFDFELTEEDMQRMKDLNRNVKMLNASTSIGPVIRLHPFSPEGFPKPS